VFYSILVEFWLTDGDEPTAAAAVSQAQPAIDVHTLASATPIRLVVGRGRRGASMPIGPVVVRQCVAVR
jgi:hypothetical protein